MTVNHEVVGSNPIRGVSGSGAVGSVPDLGSGGQRFESFFPDL